MHTKHHIYKTRSQHKTPHPLRARQTLNDDIRITALEQTSTRTRREPKEMLLSKALTCMNFFLYTCINKNGYFIMETGNFGFIVVWKIYISHTDNSTPQHTAFEPSEVCLSVVFELLPGFIPFTILWHIG